MSEARDNVMARLGAAHAMSEEAAAAFRQAIVIFSVGASEGDDEDFDGKERLGLIESGCSLLRDAAVAGQRALEGFERLSTEDLHAEEDADDEDEDDEDGDDDDDDASDEEG